MYTLYKDGINDDTLAIQEMLDSGASVVHLPATNACYRISKPLKIHSNQTLKLDETTVVKLLPKSDCYMVTNADENAHDIALIGGIWDYNNMEQTKNPISFDESGREKPSHMDGNPDTWITYPKWYTGVCMHFYKVERLTLRDFTVKDPVTYCVEIGYVRYFTVENIKFDQNLGNPKPINMDGIHIDGGCRFGSVKNVQGTCYDDIVAMNADDGCDGTIEDIEIDGVYGERALRGVRLLSTRSLVARISISNVFGTFFRNAIGLTYFYTRSGSRGKMEHISIRNVYAKNDLTMDGSNKYYYSLIWVDSDIDVDFLTIDNVCRKEDISYVETLKVCPNSHITNLSLSNICQRNVTDFKIPMFRNCGTIDKLYMYNLDAGADEVFVNEGTVGTVKEI